jgi:putative DNA primase/helicase
MSTKTPIDLRYDGSTPCPVCDSNTKGCSHLEDGGQLCRGEPVDPSRWTVTAITGMDDFKIYRPVKAASPRGKKDKPPPRVNWSAKAVHYASRLDAKTRATLAAELGVPVSAIALIPLVGCGGHTSAGVIATFPESDPDGVIVGITERDPSRETKSKSLSTEAAPGARGLILAAGWDSPPGPVLVVEGATDVLACAAAGLCVVGRPGKDAKIDWLIELCKKLPADRPIIIVGENDQKWNEDGTPKLNKDGTQSWPGREAAIKVANWMAAELPNPVTWALPPATVKDSRGWLTAAAGEWADRGRMYLGHLTAATVPAVKVLPPAEVAARGVDDPDNPDRWAVPFDAPQRLADAYLAAASPPGAPLRLRFWRDEFHEWRDGCYHTIPTGEMRSRVSLFIAAEFERVQKLQLARWKRVAETARFPQAAKVTTSLVTSVVAHLGSLCGVGMTNADAPAWIGKAAVRPPVTEIAAFRTGLLHVTTGRWMEATPEFFNFSTLAFDYDPAAPVPPAWLTFLAETWPDDRQAIDCLQEWFGYLLTPDTRQQKMLWLIGPPRSGKGTTVEVLMSLVGEANVTSPTLQQLGERFGLSPLLNSSVAWFDEPKISRHDNVPAIVGTIKRITGGSRVDIDRKGIPILKNVRLGCRFVLSANEVLELGDASGAMASRVVVISTSVSKIGREDKDLIDRLKAVLPGIFNWALAGLPRLHARGRFVQPTSGMNDAAQLRDLGSPTAQFLAESVVFDDSADVSIDSLFDEYKKWCEGENRHAGTKIGFARDLGSQLHKKHQPVRKVVDGKRTKHFPGLRLRRFYETSPDTDPTSPGNDPISPRGGFISPRLECQESTQQTLGDLTGSRTGQMAQMISPSGEMVEGISPHTTASYSSTYVDSGSNGEMKCKSSVNTGDGCEVVCVGGEEASVGWNSVSSRHLATAPDEALYFTTELDLLNYPAGSVADVLQLGPTTHYRVTPATVVTLTAMHDRAPPGPDRDRLAAVLPALWDYLVTRHPPDVLAAAEAAGQRTRPDPAAVPS